MIGSDLRARHGSRPEDVRWKPFSVPRWLLAGAISLFGISTATADEIPPHLKKDLAEFGDLFAGRWDTDRQVFFAGDAGYDLASLAPRQHLIIRPLTSDEGATDLRFEATRRVDGEGDAVLVHSIAVDPGGTGLRHSILVGDEQTEVDCHIHWSRTGIGFSGEAIGAGCPTIFPRPSSDAEDASEKIRLSLDPTNFHVKVERGDASSNAEFRKARPFSCWTAVLRGATHGDSGEGNRDWDFRRGLNIHDQGGVITLETDETPSRSVRLRLRDVDWPHGERRPSLTLYVLEGDSDRAVSYAWTEGGGERIGINLRWLQASCTYSPDDVFADY